jgi:hypothetical protein
LRLRDGVHRDAWIQTDIPYLLPKFFCRMGTGYDMSRCSAVKSSIQTSRMSMPRHAKGSVWVKI